MLKCSAALASVCALASVEVAVADDEGRMAQDGAALPARISGPPAPACMRAFCQSPAVVLEQGQNAGRGHSVRLGYN